ncbi:hypothetical protein GUG93_12640, partial [Xanthomonas citri pv. citri]|nr:hypothetical protein [Xanthomonas citri pv. citri]
QQQMSQHPRPQQGIPHPQQSQPQQQQQQQLQQQQQQQQQQQLPPQNPFGDPLTSSSSGANLSVMQDLFSTNFLNSDPLQ